MYNALESLQAFEAGTAGRKAREKETAMKGIGNALAGGDYAGGAAQAFAIDPEYGMRIKQYGDGQNALALRKDIGGMIGAGDRKGAAAKAYSAGEFEMGANIDAQIAQMTQKQREDALFLSSELGNAALTLQGITDPQQRAAQWQQMQGRFVNDFGMDPSALAQFNPMDDMALQRAIGEAQSFSDRLAGQRFDAQQAYTQKVDERNFNRGVYEYDTSRQDALDAAASNGGAGSYGLNIVWGTDANGNAVAMQPSKGGGLQVAQTPDGVSLLDPYATALDRKLGTVAAETEAGRNPAEQGVLAAEADMKRLGEQIDLAITQTDKGNTGTIGQFNVFAGDLAGTLKTIRASGAFTSLVNLKAQGGTLGALSDTELQLLEAKIANVERSQSEEQLDKNLMELKNALTQSSKRIRAAYEKEYAAGRYGRGGATAPPAANGGGSRPVGPSGQPVPEGFE